MMRKSFISLVPVAILMAMIVSPANVLRAQDSLRTSKVVASINENQLVMLGGHVAPWAISANDLGPAPDSMKVDVHLVLKRSDAQESDLQALMAEQQNRKSDNYRKWLTPEEYGTRFGISDADLAKVTAWLTSHGFVIDKVSKGNNLIRFSGTHEQLQQALHTTLHRYKVDGEVHYANTSNPMIPAALAPVIVGFYGLNDMKPKPMHTTPRLATRNKGDKDWQVLDATPVDGGPSIGIKPEYEWNHNNRTWHLMGPGDFATIYGVQPLYDTYDGTGQTIAIIAATEIRTQDTDDFRKLFGLPATKLNIIHDGPSPGIDSNYEMETDLDVQWAGAVAKNATIDLVISKDLVESMFYVVDNNLAPVMSVSYGECELYMQTAGNAFISELYKQAASQGITVLVASGDQGAATCNYGGRYSTQGLSVNGLASTPYNVAVGGTDFPVNVLGDASTYWDSTNNTSDHHSAKSYVPEAPWNESCASPEVLAELQSLAKSDPTHYSQWAADTTNELLCNDPAAQKYYLYVAGGGGGASNCTGTDTNSPSNCTAGYPQPVWQTGVPGLAADSHRHVPDVSFFSGSGLWHTALMFCSSDATPNGACFGDNMQYGLGGGTSFATPAFAGIVALLNQKTNSRLGNLNYTLYELAAQQFKDGAKKDACKVGDTTTVSDSSCIFHDVTEGNVRVACQAGTMDNPPNGVCTPADSNNQYGILSGYDAGAGYDSASGLGSLNAFNLLNSWPSSLAATQTTLTLSTASSVNYGVALTGTGSVTVTSGSGTPTGTAALMYKDANGNARGGWTTTDLVNGTGSVTLNLIAPVGVINLYARYSGDAAYAASASGEQAVTISPAATTLELSAGGSTTLGARQTTQLTATIKSASLGDYPSGTVIFKNTTTGAVIDTVTVSGYKDSQTGYAYAMASTPIGASVLTHGNNQITATFSGDTNYLAATKPVTIQYTGGFALAASSSSLTLSPGATSGNTLVFTVRPFSSGATYAASSLNFSCPGTLPAGVSCEFSAPTANPDGSIYSTLTVFLSSPLAQNSPAPLLPLRREVPMYLSMVIVGGVFVTVPRKRSAKIAIGLVLALIAGFSVGCGGHKSTTPAPATTSVTLSASSTTPALNSPVTLTATLSKTAATGTISFFDGTTLLGTATASNGAASVTTSSLPVGARSITATYSGDSIYPAATSAAVAVDVTFTSTITAQAVDVTSGNFAQQSVTLIIK